MANVQEIIANTEKYSAHNYHPFSVVVERAEGVWVEDVNGKKYIDMLSAYSAINQGHRHPKIVAALKEQVDKVTLISRAFYNDKFGDFCKKLADYTGKDMVLPMNSGAEAVETALKSARRWAYDVKKVPKDKAEIIVCDGNFHGRTISIITFSSDESAKRGFGPFTPGFKSIPYGDLDALKSAINSNTAAFLIEPIQCESGIKIPPAGFLKAAREVCKQNNVLFISDEVQTGFGRTGKRFASDWEEVEPDIYTLGKALGGGMLPVSAVAANKEILGLFEPGSHGSTFGGSPLACACSIAALDVIVEENLAERSLEMGQYFLGELKKIKSDVIKEVRGKGLLIGMELTENVMPYCEKLIENGLLCKGTDDFTIRFAPPLIITKEEIDWALDKIKKVFE